MNLLLTSVGQRGYLLDYFREGLRPGDILMAADASPYASAFASADRAFVIPRAQDPEYRSSLLTLCADKGVDGVLTINDLELPELASLSGVLADQGTRALISSPEVVEICFDKYLTVKFLESHGIGFPRTYRHDELDRAIAEFDAGCFTFPLLAKPRRGSRSHGIRLIPDIEALKLDVALIADDDLPDNQKIIYQEYIDSDQFSLEIFNDWKGTAVAVVGMVNLVPHMTGETFQAVTDDNPELLALGRELGAALGHVGPACVDVHQRGDEFVVLEINPRFGGGYPATHFSGADFTGKALAMIRGEPLPATTGPDFRPGVVMLKQYTAVPSTIAEIDRSATYYRQGGG